MYEPPCYECKIVNYPDAFFNQQSSPGRNRLVVGYRKMLQKHDDNETSDEDDTPTDGGGPAQAGSLPDDTKRAAAKAELAREGSEVDTA